MITEKAYVLGKFARVAVGTKHIDYNGRLCMVSAGTAYKLTFGIDRATNPWPDLTKARVVLIAGSNVAECSTAPGEVEELVQLASDIDDMSPEYLAATVELLRGAGALDVVVLATTMKRGRPGTRVEVLARPADAERLELMLLMETTTIGVRRTDVRRRALPRELRTVDVLGHPVTVKVVQLPGGGIRAKPEFTDVQRVAEETGRPLRDIFQRAADQAERQ